MVEIGMLAVVPSLATPSLVIIITPSPSLVTMEDPSLVLKMAAAPNLVPLVVPVLAAVLVLAIVVQGITSLTIVIVSHPLTAVSHPSVVIGSPDTLLEAAWTPATQAVGGRQAWTALVITTMVTGTHLLLPLLVAINNVSSVVMSVDDCCVLFAKLLIVVSVFIAVSPDG